MTRLMGVPSLTWRAPNTFNSRKAVSGWREILKEHFAGKKSTRENSLMDKNNSDYIQPSLVLHRNRKAW